MASGEPIDSAEYRGRKWEDHGGGSTEVFPDCARFGLECAAIQDVWVVGQGLEDREGRERKMELDRMAAMLSRLGKRGYSVQEESAGYRIDFDSDFDSDPDGIISQQAGAGQPATRPVVEPEGSDNPQPEAEGRSR